MNQIPRITSNLFFIPLETTPSNFQILCYVIRQLYKRKAENRYYYSTQYASLIFGNGIDDQDKISKVRSSFKQYIDYNGRKFRFKLDLLFKNYPEIWGLVPKIEEIDIEMVTALDQEIASQLKEKKFLFLHTIKELNKVDAKWVFLGCYDDEDESQILLPEGVDVDLLTNAKKYQVTVLEQDNVRNAITFSYDSNIEFGSRTRLSANPEMLLVALRDKINGYSVSSLKHSGLYNNQVRFDSCNTKKSYEHLLSSSQLDALNKCLSQDLNYIWGPPGTGKTHVLARILVNLYLAGERTMVCSIANVAVDGIALKFLEVADEYNKTFRRNILKDGEILRVGYVKSKELLERDEIYPENALVKSLVHQKEILLQKKSELKGESEAYSKILSQIHELSKRIQDEIKRLIDNAKIIFCTSSKAIIDEIVFANYFDNLVIDEGSMMSPASLFPLLRKQPKRAIIAGDFRQLGPIAIGRSELIDKWLRRSLFDLLGEEEKIPSHLVVSMLKEQRRSNKAIVKLISEYFYGKLLISIPDKKHNLYLHLEPNPSKSIAFINLTNNSNYRVQRSKSQSRYNMGSLQKGLSIVKNILDTNTDINIGIITPYKAQANLYRKETQLYVSDTELFKSHLKIGTIHSFQGSESDVIIFDMVDSIKDIDGKDISIGNLFQGKQGEQLINVAVSRAISKLIIIGCKDVLSEGAKRHLVSSKTKQLVRKAFELSIAQVG